MVQNRQYMVQMVVHLLVTIPQMRASKETKQKQNVAANEAEQMVA
jgi:hypothetical protein